MDYGKAVAIIRTAKGLSQKNLAQLIGKAPSYISRLENNQRKPSSETIDLICDKLEIPTSLFLLLAKNYDDMDETDKYLIDEMGSELLKIITQG